MSTERTLQIVAGWRLKDVMTHPSTKKKKVTKYNEDTGEPYFKMTLTTVLVLFGHTFEVPSEYEMTSQYGLLDFLEGLKLLEGFQIISSPETFFSKDRLVPEEYENWLIGTIVREVPMDYLTNKEDFLFKTPLVLDQGFLGQAYSLRDSLYVKAQKLAFSKSKVDKPELFVRYDIS